MREVTVRPRRLNRQFGTRPTPLLEVDCSHGSVTERTLEVTMSEGLTTLIVMPQERRSTLVNQLAGIDVNVLTASSCGEAADMLRVDPRVRVVLTDLSLPDGSWFDVLNRVGDINAGAEVVVCARLADERLWTQVLEAGGFDVLVEPYEKGEVKRIVDAAATGRPLARRLAAAS